MEELLKALEEYIERLVKFYNIDRETALKVITESLQQSSVFEKLYTDACYVVELKYVKK